MSYAHANSRWVSIERALVAAAAGAIGLLLVRWFGYSVSQAIVEHTFAKQLATEAVWGSTGYVSPRQWTEYLMVIAVPTATTLAIVKLDASMHRRFGDRAGRR